MTPARLRIVESPEQELARLFEREREIIAGLAAVREAIDAARVRYGVKHQLLAKPRVELLRTRLMKNGGAA